MRRIRRHLTFANVASATALFLVLGGTAYAATGETSSSGTRTRPARQPRSRRALRQGLQVTNNSTGAGATALGLNVASGHPPFAVNSGTKVANLNADKLDGLDSSGLVKGRGTLLSNRLVLVPADPDKTLLVIPGLGELRATCEADGGAIDWANTTSSTIDRWEEAQRAAGPPDWLRRTDDRIVADSADQHRWKACPRAGQRSRRQKDRDPGRVRPPDRYRRAVRLPGPGNPVDERIGASG